MHAHRRPSSRSVRSLWRRGVAARAPARFAAVARAAHAPAANAKRRALRFVSVSVRCVGVGGTEALRSDAAEPAMPSSVPVRVAYELQQAGHRYLDVRYRRHGTATLPVSPVSSVLIPESDGS